MACCGARARIRMSALRAWRLHPAPGPILCTRVVEPARIKRHFPSPHSTLVMRVAIVPAGKLTSMRPVAHWWAGLTMLTSMEFWTVHMLASIWLAPLTRNPPTSSPPSRYVAHVPPVSTFASRLVTAVKSGVVGKAHMMMPLAPWLMLSIVIATSSSAVGVCFQNWALPNACGVPQRTFGGRPS